MGKNTQYLIDEEYFKNINSSQKAFWLGFICADGSIYKNRNILCLSITQSNDVLFKQFVTDIQFTGEIKTVNKTKGRFSDKQYFRIIVYNQPFIKNLLNVGKTIKKHDLKNIPNTIPEIFLKDYIRGYFEGDGTLYYDINNLSWCMGFSGNYGFLNSIKKHFLNVFQEELGSIGSDKSIYSYRLHGNIITNKILNYLYYNNDVYGIKIKKRSENV